MKCFEGSSFDDNEVLEFQEYLVNYIEDYWINGVFPPRVWSAWDRDDATNNNSEVIAGNNNTGRKEVGQGHPAPTKFLRSVALVKGLSSM